MTSDSISSSACCGSCALDQEQVAPDVLVGGERGRLAAPDRVRAAHDHAARRLAEDVRELCHGHDLRGDELRERLPGADGRELVGVADEHDVHLVAHRPQQRDQQLEVGHARLVDDEQVGVDLVLGRALPGNPAERRVDRRRVHPGRLRHPARRAAGGGDERDGRALRLGRRADQPDRRGLAGAGAARDDRHPRREGGHDRGPLLGRRGGGCGGGRRRGAAAGDEGAARAPGRPAWPAPDRLGVAQAADRLGQLGLQRGGRRAVGPDDRRVGLEVDLAGGEHVLQQLGVRPRPAEQLGGAGHEFGHRQAGRAVALGLAEHVGDRGPHAADAVARDARRARDRVRDREPDAEDARELVGAAAHDVVRAVAVLGRDPRHQPGEAVRREQEVQRAGGAQAVPRADRLVGPLGVQAGRPERTRRVLVDREQHVVAVAFEQPRRPPDADVLDAPQVGDQRLVARGRHRLGDPHLDLQAEALVVGPHALDAHALALLEVRERPDEHDVVPLAIGVDDGEARVLGREAQPPHHHLVRERRPGLTVDHPRRPYNAAAGVPEANARFGALATQCRNWYNQGR